MLGKALTSTERASFYWRHFPGHPAHSTSPPITTTLPQESINSTPNNHTTHPTPTSKCTNKRKKKNHGRTNSKNNRRKKPYKPYVPNPTIQMTLHHRPSFLEKLDAYGDSSKQKAKDVGRFVTSNPGGLNVHHTETKELAPADKTSQTFIGYANMKADIGGLLEPNIEWRNQPPEGSFYNRKKTCPKQPIKAVVASGQQN